MINKQFTHNTLLQSGFRLFFLGALVYAIVSILVWTWQLYVHADIPLTAVSRAQWHAHEMLFGYAVAVIVGFLTTAVKNWTGRTTVEGRPLLLLFVLWLSARVLAVWPTDSWLLIILVIDSLFYAMLIAFLIRPIVLSKNQAQWGIIAKLVLLWLLDVLFLMSALGWLEAGYASPVLLISVYTIIGLILVMAQRVLPFFIRNAISNRSNVKDYPYVPIVSLLSFLLLVIADVAGWPLLLLISGLAVAAVNLVRLYGWHDREIWHKPLLWVLYVGLYFIIAGILLRSSAHYMGTFPHLGLHAMTVGGIGLITVGMMARVALGHTGRDVFDPPYGLSVIFLLLIASAVLRAFVPLAMIEYYFVLILVSQILWISAFVLMLVIYFGPLTSKRVDGVYG